MPRVQRQCFGFASPKRKPVFLVPDAKGRKREREREREREKRKKIRTHSDRYHPPRLARKLQHGRSASICIRESVMLRDEHRIARAGQSGRAKRTEHPGGCGPTGNREGVVGQGRLRRRQPALTPSGRQNKKTRGAHALLCLSLLMPLFSVLLLLLLNVVFRSLFLLLAPPPSHVPHKLTTALPLGTASSPNHTGMCVCVYIYCFTKILMKNRIKGKREIKINVTTTPTPKLRFIFPSANAFFPTHCIPFFFSTLLSNSNPPTTNCHKMHAHTHFFLVPKTMKDKASPSCGHRAGRNRSYCEQHPPGTCRRAIGSSIDAPECVLPLAAAN